MSLNRGIPAWRKATAGFIGTALTAGALVVVGATAPAHAAPADPTLTWSVSGQFVNHFSPKPYAPLSGITATDGASFNDGVGTFAAATVTRSAGETVYAYEGTLEGAFITSGPTEQYAVAISDPAVTVTADGSGRLTALASSRQLDGATTAPTRVTVAEFATSTLVDGVLSVTPNWEDVLQPDSPTAVELGAEAGHPVEGRSFHPEFLGALTEDVRAHFYATAADQDHKAPAEIVANTGAFTKVSVVRTSADYVDLSIAGSDFDLTKNNQPGRKDGVYVGVAPTGTDIFAIESGGQADGMSKFVASDHVPASAFTDGSFTKPLPVEVAKLTRGGNYSVFTWSAHGNPQTGDQLYTATPIALDWSKVPTPSVAKIKTKTKKPKANVKKKQVVIKAKVNAAGKATAKGKVRFVVKKGKKTIFKKKVKVNKKGVAKLKLKKKKLRKLLKGKRIQGKYQVRAKFLGNKQFAAAKVSKSRFRIK